MKLKNHLAEAINDYYHSLVDPTEPYWDAGEDWSPVVHEMNRLAPGSGVVDENTLREIRNQCRTLAATNEFAINGHENRISYLVGTGHTYRATVRKGCGVSAEACLEVQRVIDEFVRENRWQRRQQEIVRRLDRDGEVFLRFFATAEGGTLVRFVEPGQVAMPSDPTWTRLSEPRLPVPTMSGLAYVTFGILTDPHDVETVRGYFVDGQLVDAGEIQHRKANVDANVKRGMPLYYPVRKNLLRADKLLTNMSAVATIQSAIAMIRKHRHGTQAGLHDFVARQADTTAPDGSTVHRYGPGTILDTHADVDYDFPASNLDAANYVAVLQAELRAIAARLVMPEFMFSSDASNSNFASTMVAEGPAVRMFARLQADLMADDLAVMWRVVENGMRAGRLPSDLCEQVEIQIGAPSLPVRDQLKEAQAFRIEHEAGILSPQTWSQRRGLDYDQEQENWEMHQCQMANPKSESRNPKPTEVS